MGAELQAYSTCSQFLISERPREDFECKARKILYIVLRFQSKRRPWNYIRFVEFKAW